MSTPEHEPAPAFRAPPLACDAHFHVFGPPGRYPYLSVPGAALRYAPPVAPLDAYLALVRPLGIERMVFVQPSAYGRDNACMLDAMAQVGPAACRGIVDLDEDVPEADLARLDALGVRGIRINVRPIEARDPDLSRRLTPRIDRLEARCREIGWHLDFLLPDWLSSELMPRLLALRVPFTIAHLGMARARDGLGGAAFRAVLDALHRSEGNCRIKLTGCYRISDEPDYADLAPMVQALLEAAPDRLIWGSDFPHLSHGDRSTVALFNLLLRWAPDEDVRRRILVDNPAELYGWSRCAGG